MSVSNYDNSNNKWKNRNYIVHKNVIDNVWNKEVLVTLRGYIM